MKNANTKLLLICILVSLMTFTETFARQYFDKSTDLLLACFDLRPDEDDVHSAAALGCMLIHPDLAGINYYAVAGAYGTQGGTFINTAVPGFYNNVFGAENTYWTNANANWSASITRARDKVIPVLNAGGKVFVQEAGQSDFTYDVLNAVINAGVSLATVQANVIVVQHSDWNEDNATQSELTWVKNNTDYVRIEDGNNNNSTPDYNINNTTWLAQAKASTNPNTVARDYWTEADAICDNFTSSWENESIGSGGVDFSDCSENWYIFDIGTDADNVTKFWARYVTNSTVNVPVTGVSVSPNTSSIEVGETTNITATVSPSNASNKNVNWSTSNGNIASVSNGVVAGVGIGTATITATTVDGGYTSSSTITVSASTGTTYNLNAVQDAYLQGSTRYNTADLRVESGNRVSYLMFDLSGLSGSITIADLKLSVSNDAGNGVMNIAKGNNNNWTETNLSSSNAPTSSGQIGTLNTNYSIGQTYTWGLDQSAISPGGMLSVIVTQSSGGDVSFASDENSNASLKPVLTIRTSNEGGDIDVDGVSISPTSLSLVAGNTGALTATVSPSNATNKAVGWSSNNTSVATVNSNGVVTAVAAGSASITVTTTDGGFTATSAVTVTSANVSVTGVSVSPTSTTLTSAGATQALTETVSPSNATNKTVSWSSNNTSVATVNSSGVVTAVANGSATISVTTQDGSFTATSAITIDIVASGQTPYGGSVRSIPGTIEAEEYDNGGEGVAYHDNDANNAGANVMREDEGVDIEARDGGISVGWTAAGEWMEYTVNATAGTYEMQARVAAVAAGKTITVKLDGVTLGVINVPNTGNWGTFQTVSVPNVSIAGGSGKILRIELTTGGANLNWVSFTSTSTNVPVTGVSVTPTSLSVAEGASGNLSETVSPSNATNQTVSWSSSNTSVATVNSSGVVTGVSAGSATVSVTTTDGGFTASSAITVTGGGGTEPTTVTLSPIHDAYLQNSTRYNNTLIRIESGRRVGYLMYDLSSIDGTITAAELKLTCTGDAGNGNININLGNGTSWTETDLSTSNAPSAGALLGNLNTTYSTGSTYTASLSAGSISGGSNLSIVLTQTGGNDVAFASKENSATEPQLVITYDAPKSANESIAKVQEVLEVQIYPNPVSGSEFSIAFNNINDEPVRINIMDLQGRILYNTISYSNQVIVPTDIFSASGLYLIKIENQTTIDTQKLLVR